MSFGLDFADKRAVLAELTAEPTSAVRMLESGDPHHVLVEGDNLDALRHLRRAYAQRVQMIYIDPPYNTGNDFVYRDRYAESEHAYRERTAQPDRDLGLTHNPKSAGCYHSSWLAMIYPRLFIARELLAHDGLMFVSIDDHEVHHLRVLMDEIFGAECFIAQVVVVTNRGGRDYLRIATGHEYLLVYGGSPSAQVRELPKLGPDPKHRDTRGAYELRELRNRNPRFTPTNRPNLHYPVHVDPDAEDEQGCCPISLVADAAHREAVVPLNSKGEGSVWRWGQPKLGAACVPGDTDRSEVVARRRRDGVFNIYEKHRKRTAKAKGLWDDVDVRTERGTIELREALGDALFDHPKPLALVRRCLALATHATETPDAVVLDFFAGSGTTAHAVIQQNRADGGRRRSVSIQVDAPVAAGSRAARAGVASLAEITRRRIQHALGGAAPRRVSLEAGSPHGLAPETIAVALQCGLGLGACTQPQAVRGWTVLVDGARWLAIPGPDARLRDVAALAPPENAMFWLAPDVGEDWERIALASRHIVRVPRP